MSGCIHNRRGVVDLCALGLLGLCACSQAPDTLSGSLDEIAPLSFTSVQVRAGDTALVVEYDRSANGGTDIPFKLVVDPDGLTLAQGLSIDLAQLFTDGGGPILLDDGNPRATCSRSVSGDPRQQLPPILFGSLTLDSNVSLSNTATGHFHILLGEGGQIGEGRTVDGTYSAQAVAANPGASP